MPEDKKAPIAATPRPGMAKASTAERYAQLLCGEFAEYAKSKPELATKIWTETENTGKHRVLKKAPRRIIVYGRSKAGKSFWLNNTCGCLLDHNIPFLMLDVDQDNASLTRRFRESTIRLRHNEDFDFRELYKETLDFQAKRGVDIFIDIGFGRCKAFRDYACQSNLQAVEEEYGIRSVLVLPITTDIEDLMPIELLDGVYLPKDVLLVFNEHSVPPGQDLREAFQHVLDDPRIRGLVKRGARTVHFPRLPDGHKIIARNAPLGHSERSDWDNPLHLMERVGAKRFLDSAWRRMQAVSDVVPFPAGDRP